MVIPMDVVVMIFQQKKMQKNITKKNMKVVKINKDLSHKDITLLNKFKTFSLYLLTIAVIGLSVAFTTIRPDVINHKGSHTVDTIYSVSYTHLTLPTNREV